MQSVGVLGGEESADAAGVSDRAKREFYVGTNAISVRRDNMRIEGVMRDGVIVDWDKAEAIMEHSFKACMSGEAAPPVSTSIDGCRWAYECHERFGTRVKR